MSKKSLTKKDIERLENTSGVGIIGAGACLDNTCTGVSVCGSGTVCVAAGSCQGQSTACVSESTVCTGSNTACAVAASTTTALDSN